jgi:hypothetical protein
MFPESFGIVVDVEAMRSSICRHHRFVGSVAVDGGGSPHAPRDRGPLLMGVAVVAEIEEHGEHDPEPVQPLDPLRRRADEQPDQGRER